jgi:hypothetical protein
MKKLAVTLASVLFIVISTTTSRSQTKGNSVQQLVASVSEAYSAKDLARLDATHPYRTKVRVVIEHSLTEDNRFVIRNFRTLAKADQWLKSRETTDGFPARETRPLKKCRNGLCIYDFDGGVDHNHLYLEKIGYGYRNGHPYIKLIYLLDGD